VPDRPSWLPKAVDQGIITEAQADALAALAAEEKTDASSGASSFQASHLLYYLGGLIAVGAMSVLMTLGWEQFGGRALVLIALAYGALGLLLTERLVRAELKVAAGLTAVLVVVLAPLAVYGAQLELGFWPEGAEYQHWLVGFDGRGLALQAAGLATAIFLLTRYRLPFIAMPVAVIVWYIAMNLVPYVVVLGVPSDAAYRTAAAAIGLLLIGSAVYIDAQRHGHPFAFWVHLVGILSAWGSLTAVVFATGFPPAGYAASNTVLLFVGVALQRRLYTIVGALGVTGYLFHLAHDVFADSFWFPLVLTLIGLGIIGAGVLWQRYEAHLTRWVRERWPFNR